MLKIILFPLFPCVFGRLKYLKEEGIIETKTHKIKPQTFISLILSLFLQKIYYKKNNFVPFLHLTVDSFKTSTLRLYQSFEFFTIFLSVFSDLKAN